MMPREGTLIADRYRLERKVGGGRVAAMWLVRDQVTEGACAVKLLHRSMNEHPEALARFSLEDRLARELTGIYFPERVGSGSWQSMRYIAWHWYEGECLRALFDRNPKQDVQTVNSIAQETCNALSMVHGAGYTHGDLKPENLFFAERGEKEKEASRQLKLLGFGVASRLSRPLLGAQGRRTPGQIIGTPLYLSPDLILGRVPRGGQADLWALAVIVYEALTGRAPFLGDDIAGVLGAILEKQAPKPTSIAEKLPGSFDLWWAQALEQGFATPAEFATSLSRALAPALRSSRTQRSASLPTSAGASGETVVGTTRSGGVAASPSGPTGASPALRAGIPRASVSSGPAAKQASSTPTVPRADGSASKLSRPAPVPGGEAATASSSGDSSTTGSPDAAAPPAPQPTSAAAAAAEPAGTATVSAEAHAPTNPMAGAPVTATPGAIAGAVSARDVGGTTSQGLAPAANTPGAGAAGNHEGSSPKAAPATPRAPAVTSASAPAPRAMAERNVGASGAQDASLSAPEITPHAAARAPTPRAAAVAKATPSKATPSKSPGAATESSAAHTATTKEASNAALFREAVAAATDPSRASAASPPRPHAAASARRDPAAASPAAAAAAPTALPSLSAPSPKAAFPEAAVQPLSLGTSSTAPGIGPAAVAMIRALQNAAADAAASIRVVGPRTGNFSPLPSPLSDFASTGSRKTLVGIIPPLHAGSPRGEAGATLPAAASAAPGAAPFVKRTGASGREAVSAIEGAPCKPIEVSEEEDAAEAAYFNNPVRRAGHPTVPFARPRAARRSAARDTVPHDTVPDLDRAFEMDAPPGSAPWTMRTTRTLRLVLTDSGHRPHLVAGMLVCGAAALVIFALGRSPMAGTGALGQSTHSLEPPAGPANSGSAAEATSSAAPTSEPGVEPVPQLAADAPADAPSAAPESGEAQTINGTGGADPSAESVNGAAPSPAANAPHLAGKEIAPGLVVPAHPASPSAPHSKPEKPKAPETSPPLRVPPSGVLSPTPSLTTNLPNSQKPPGTEPLGAAGRPASVKPGAKRPGTEPGAPRPANGDFDFGI